MRLAVNKKCDCRYCSSCTKGLYNRKGYKDRKPIEKKERRDQIKKNVITMHKKKVKVPLSFMLLSVLRLTIGLQSFGRINDFQTRFL